jgi:AcrR family transcriptional regulator
MPIDRRAVATRNRIGEAFLRLGGMRAIEAIRVEDLAREAGIARSTFYAHFKGLDDYMARSFAAMLEALASRGAGERILPVAAIVSHVTAVGEGAHRLARHRHFPRMLSEGERALRRVAELRLAARFPALDTTERSAMATMLAAGFLALLRDWMEDPHGRNPQEIPKRFETLEVRLVGEAPVR